MNEELREETERLSPQCRYCRHYRPKLGVCDNLIEISSIPYPNGSVVRKSVTPYWFCGDYSWVRTGAKEVGE